MRRIEIDLQEPRYQYDPTVCEPKSVWFNGELVEASCFGEMEFLAVCEQVAGVTRSELIRIGNAYKDMKLIFGYDGIRRRLTGEEYYQHSKAVTLIGMLELDLKDADQIIAHLHHDSPEENAVFYGNTDHPRRLKKGIHISTIDSLRAKYGIRSAKMIDAVTKPPLVRPKHEMTPAELYQYLQDAYLKVVKSYPEVAKECARVKTADRIQNMRTEPKSPEQMVGQAETFEERLARRVLETHNLILPIAGLAGENYRDLLEKEIEAPSELLTLQQRAQLVEDPLIVQACKDASRSRVIRVFARFLRSTEDICAPPDGTAVEGAS